MTVTDTLLTLLEVKGTAEVVTAFGEMTAGLVETATAEGAATEATGVLATAIGALGVELAPVLGLLAAFAGSALLAGKALEAFGEAQATITRTAIQLNNLKGSIPLPELLEFSDHLSELTGISHNVITSLGATAAQFGLTGEQIKKVLPTVLDIAQAKNLSPEEVLNKLLRATRGRPQGLVALGIDPSKIQGDLKDVNNLINQVGKGFAGTAEAFRNTLPGTTSALKDSVERLFEALGRFLSPVVVPILNLLIGAIDKLTALLNRVANAFPRLFPTAGALGVGGASDIALKGDPEQTEYQRQIAQNTKQQAEAFIKGVLGGPGDVARGAFVARDARIAFGI